MLLFFQSAAVLVTLTNSYFYAIVYVSLPKGSAAGYAVVVCIYSGAPSGGPSKQATSALAALVAAWLRISV